MTTSARTSLTSIASPEFSPRQLAFLEGLAQNRAHEAVLELLRKLSSDGTVTRALIAKKLGRSPSQVTRWLGSPGNWTLQTLGILMGAMGYLPVIGSQPIGERVATNYAHPAADLGRTGIPFPPLIKETPAEASSKTAAIPASLPGQNIRIVNSAAA